ncbi:MAG: TRAP transporter small permease subunit [Clostridiales Family XIII bacterium]|nr:TRAP transporter small permease subunit [Clostridiales Family XIII bacterium]
MTTIKEKAVASDMGVAGKRISAMTRFCNLFREISMWVLFIDVIVIVVNIILRRIFNAPIFGVTEVIRYLMLFGASFALLENEWVDGNVNMLILLDKMSQKMRAVVFSITNLVISVGMIFISVLLVQQVVRRYGEHTTSYELNIPVWLIELALTVGCWLLTVGLVGKTIIWFWMVITGSHISFRELGSLRDE